MINPLGNRILVKVREEEVKEGEEQKKKGNEVFFAEVVAVGKNVETVKVGDVVIFPPFGFDEVWVTEGSDVPKKMVVISEEMIIATE